MPVKAKRPTFTVCVIGYEGHVFSTQPVEYREQAVAVYDLLKIKMGRDHRVKLLQLTSKGAITLSDSNLGFKTYSVSG